ncbi:hypothetical protein FDUTEX481_03401 [Tolypothrix sp. PCC 7601]|nr:hypothetical protein FDUTEX481_03401 [Tolypothrix sp. PCC 7601]
MTKNKNAAKTENTKVLVLDLNTVLENRAKFVQGTVKLPTNSKIASTVIAQTNKGAFVSDMTQPRVL